MEYYGNQQIDCNGSYLPNINYYINDAYNQGMFPNQMEGSMNGYYASGTGIEPMTGGEHKRRLSDLTNENGVDDHRNKKKKGVNPFAPECSIPLPYQLGDEFGYYGPVSIFKRNERERHRVRCVNEGYEKLRSTLPFFDKDKRLSKVETLRLAIRYIRHLQKLLINENHDEECNCHLDEHTDDSSNNSERKISKGKQRSCSDDSDSYEDGEF